MSTHDWIDELERLHKAATPGPWGTGPTSGGGLLLRRGEYLGKDRHPQSHLQVFPPEDCTAIVAAHNALPRLLAIARAAREYMTVLNEPVEYGSMGWAIGKRTEALTRLRRALDASEVDDGE